MRRFVKFVFWCLFVIIVVVPIVLGIGYLFWEKRDGFDSGGSKIGVVYIKGIISDPREYLEGLRVFKENAKIKAIILRVDSPGGGVGASQELYREVEKVKAVKPVVASLGGIATSGGYYAISSATKIVANPGTVTGSIGVIIAFPNFEKLFEKIGYSTIVIKSGTFKDVGNPSRPMTPDEESLLRDTVMEVHEQFVKDVARARNIEEEQVRAIADGRIITGAKAKSLGLVDELGNFNDAIEIAKMIAKIEEKPSIIYYEKKKKLIDFLIGEETMEGFKKEMFNLLNPLQLRLP